MEQEILFKSIDNKVTIIANENLSFESFLEKFKKRLENLYIKDDLLKANVVIDIKNITLESKKILQLFDVLATYGNLYVKSIIHNEKTSKSITLHEGNIRAGEIKLFINNTLLIGNINKGAKVIVNGSLYVIGKVNGNVEFKNINNKLICASIEDTNVKICSYEKKIDELKENTIIKIENNEIVESRFMDRRGNQYGKSNCSYIW